MSAVLGNGAYPKEDCRRVCQVTMMEQCHHDKYEVQNKHRKNKQRHHYMWIFEWLLNWFYSLLIVVSGYNRELRAVMVGLDNAGKSTLVQRFNGESLRLCSLSRFPNIEQLVLSRTCTLKVYDIPGHEQCRRLWRDYYFEALDALLFIVDASDRTRFDEAREELHKILETEVLRDVPVLVIGNKIDVANASSLEELELALDLKGKTTGKDLVLTRKRPVELFMTSAVTLQNADQTKKWLEYQIRSGF